MKPTHSLVVAAYATLTTVLPVARGDVDLVNSSTPWRGHLVVGRNILRKDGQLFITEGNGGQVRYDADPKRFSPLPAKGWTEPGFDDSCWARYLTADLVDFLGDSTTPAADPIRGTWSVRVALRSCFGVAEPAKVRDLKLQVTYIGGVVVYVNGQEIGRGALPTGQVEPFTPAADYPLEAYTTDDGKTPLPETVEGRAPDPKWAARYGQRLRTLSVDVPAKVLVPGRNVIAVSLHRAAQAGPVVRDGWIHVGVREITLTSVSGNGVVPYDAAAKGTHVWSANAVDQVAESPSVKSLIKRRWFWTLYLGRGLPVRGIQQGNPLDALLPVKITIPRNGVGSGQSVLTDADGLRDVTATLEPLRGPGGAVLPASGVQIWYAAQQTGVVHYCDALLPQPAAGAKTVPVWLIVQASKDQTPGWYTSTLRLGANGKTFAVPVQVLVTGYTLPATKDFVSTVGMTQSPETIAKHYGVELWSDAHWRLLENSLALLGQVGNDVVHVPIVTSGVGGTGKTGFNFAWQPLIRFVRTDKGLQADYSILEKYLDAYAKHCGPPKALSLYLWGYNSAKEYVGAYEGGGLKKGFEASESKDKFTPPRVLVWDRKTGATVEEAVPVIGDEGSEQFYKPLVDGVRALVVERGWSERSIMLGLGGDFRPGRRTVDLFKAWVPYARWDFLSHFSGDPIQNKEGKLIATGGAEMGMREWPSGGVRMETWLASPLEFLDLPTDRWLHQPYSPPLTFRTLKSDSGSIGRLGLDFWQAGKGGPRSTSFFSHVETLTVPGPDGPCPTVRFQMFRECVQDYEVKAAILKALPALPEEQRTPYRALLNELDSRKAWSGGFYLGQQELSYDWPGYVARLHEAAAELSGATPEARWSNPPR